MQIVDNKPACVETANSLHLELQPYEGSWRCKKYITTHTRN